MKKSLYGISGVVALAMVAAMPVTAQNKVDAQTSADVQAEGQNILTEGSQIARHHDRKKKDGIGAGEVIAGAVILGGIAALAISAGKKGDRDYDYGDDYGAREAVSRCVREAKSRASHYGKVKGTEITDIDRIKKGYRVEGRIKLKSNWRDNDRDWGRDRGRDDDHDDGMRPWNGSEWDSHDRDKAKREDREDRRDNGIWGSKNKNANFYCETKRGKVKHMEVSPSRW